MTSQLKHVLLSEIRSNPFEFRTSYDDLENFSNLGDSIKHNGIIQTITLRKHNNHYQVIAGSRRVRAAKKLKQKTIPAIIRSDLENDDIKSKIISLSENTMRLEISDNDTALGLAEIYQDAGFNIQTTLTHITKYDKDSSDKSIPNEFKQICKEFGIKPRKQRNYLYIARDLSPSVLKQTEKLGLTMDKKLMLRSPIIKNDPKLQKTVAGMIKNMDSKSAKSLVRNIEERNYKFTGKSFRINDSDAKATLKPQEFTDEARMFFTVNVGMINDLVGHFTNSYKKVYSDEFLDRTVNFRLEKIKQLKEPDLYNWYNSMVPLINILDEMKKELEREFRTREKQKEMIGR